MRGKMEGREEYDPSAIQNVEVDQIFDFCADFSNISSISIKLKKSIHANNRPPQCLSFSSTEDLWAFIICFLTLEVRIQRLPDE